MNRSWKCSASTTKPWCAFFFVSAALAADPAGWSRARWGMSDAQILDAFAGQAVPLEALIPAPDRAFQDGGVAAIGIPSLAIGSIDCQVFFLTQPAGLHRIMIHPADTDDATYAALESRLVEKYGRAWSRTTDVGRLSQWTLDTTLVRLELHLVPAIRFRSLWLTYTRRHPDDNL